MPRIGGSLPTTIADTEKQLNSSGIILLFINNCNIFLIFLLGSYNARKMMREKIMKGMVL